MGSRIAGMARLLLACAALCLLPVDVWAQQDVRAGQRRLQEDLTTQRAVAIARERRLVDERELALLAQVDARDAALRRALRSAQTNQTDAVAARAALAGVVAERGRLVEALAERDRAYAVEVAEFRRQIAGLTGTASLALTVALARQP